MRLISALSLTLLLSGASAQTAKTFNDPANLRGERVKAHDGRELPVDQGASGLQQMLRRLNTRASLMLIVAHPDDEDSGMTTLYSRGQGARVAMLTLNRGEGGQNAMTGDFEDALGLLRTQELLAEDRYSSVDQMFGTEVDFGFSKTKEEAFAKWTHDRVLYDAVRAVRLYRPLVIAAVFVGGVTDGHGQHQVSGQIAQEVFKAAADPKVFPELTAEGILPWQPLKVYARVPMQAISEKGLFDYATNQYTAPRFENYVTGEVTTTPPNVNVVIHEGEPDSLLRDADGKTMTYVQFARTGLALQKSQIGPGMRTPPAGKFDVSYHRYGSALPGDKQKQEEASFFDGIDTSLDGIAMLAPGAIKPDQMAQIADAIQKATKQFDAQHPAAIAPPLAEALKQTDAVLVQVTNWSGDPVQKANALHELRVKRVQLNDALALALGPHLDAVTDRPDVVRHSTEIVRVEVSEIRDVKPVFPISVRSANASMDVNEQLDKSYDPHSAQPIKFNLKLMDRMTDTRTEPYFYRDNIEQAVYKLRDPELRLAPATPAALTAWSKYTYMGATFEVGRVVHNGAQAVQVVAPASLSLSAHAQVLPDSESAIGVSSFLHPATNPAIQPMLTAPAGWTVRPTKADGSQPGETRFMVTAPSTHRATVTVQASAHAADGDAVREGYRPIGYGDLPRTNYYTPAVDTIVPVDLKLPEHRRIAFLPGTGDAVPEALASIGLKTDTLTMADLTVDKLKQYDTVILGVRTYAAHPDLHGAPTKALLDYARAGGNVVVQYQRSEFTGDDAPYPLALGHDAENVVDETDPVHVIDASSPLLSTPNKITSADFNGWVEERGHSFLSKLDSHYATPLEVHDPGEEPQRGGLVTTQLGNGRWTYVAFAIYRQLPEAVPGAFRLFVNLLQK
jgi:LmbE family N-acetylglucosaminyl deacetylase